MQSISNFRLGLAGALAVVAALLALVPVLCITIPGFVDAPAHMARHHILALAPLGGPLARHYAVHWQWIANLGEDLPAALLGRWLGGETATRLVTATIAPLTIAGIVAMSRAAHGRVSGSALLAMPFVLNQAWMYGFLNYGIGTALALLVAASLIGHKQESALGQVALAAAALGVCTAHLASWGLLLLVGVGIELGSLQDRRDIVPALRRFAPLLAPAIPFVLWRSGSGGSDFAFSYENALLNKLAAFAGALRGTWLAVDLTLLMVTLVAAGVALRASRRVDRRLFCAGLLLVAATLAVPTYMLSSWAWATDMRTAPFAILLLILSIRPATDPRRERLIVLIGFALFLARVTSVTWAWAERSPMLEQRLGMLVVVPRGGSLGFLYVPASCDGWQLKPDEKLGSYAVTRRDAFVNTLFMLDKARVVTIRDPHLLDRWVSDSQRVSYPCPQSEPSAPSLDRALDAMRRDRFDAIWVSGVPQQNLPHVEGYVVTRQLPNETMLVRR